jgi:hypothetical protein
MTDSPKRDRTRRDQRARVHYSVGDGCALCERPDAHRITPTVGDVTCMRCLRLLVAHPEVAT